MRALIGFFGVIIGGLLLLVGGGCSLFLISAGAQVKTGNSSMSGLQTLLVMLGISLAFAWAGWKKMRSSAAVMTGSSGQQQRAPEVVEAHIDRAVAQHLRDLQRADRRRRDHGEAPLAGEPARDAFIEGHTQHRTPGSTPEPGEGGHSQKVADHRFGKRKPKK